MEKDRIKWNERYSGSGYFFSLTPSRALANCIELVESLVPGRRALDIACGEGRNAIFLAGRGFEVDGVDIAELGLERGRQRAGELGLTVNFIQADLEECHLQGSYDVILNFNFLLRPLIPEMVEALSPGGVIVMETILNGPNIIGTHSAEFLLQPGELLQIFSQYEGRILESAEEPGIEMPVARVIFQKKGV
ncbi:class I SAM-dependent methyltransferase [Geomonas sp.]|uniref:class I SAM-dependent methyltransferase n=1 Tax=Geomonas sp. TaxID=2651584 RepID=UPI002B4A2F13|nr:class I SAM-dependent methyltransferase [Geomonas sp.]HJV35901.1 class I SAM-dependent methyltransferase [Geomonas sp.]